MAIDTAAKRSSCLDYDEVWTAGIPFPSGTVDQAARQHLLWSYSGILVSQAALASELRAYAIPHEDRECAISDEDREYAISTKV